MVKEKSISDKRVRYFPRRDLFCGLNLERIETLTIPNVNDIDVNDAIEYYHIKRYCDEGVFLKTWTLEEQELYKRKSKNLFSLTVRFFKEMNDTNILAIYRVIESAYRGSFWELFADYNVYDSISEDVFLKLLEIKDTHTHDVFLYKKIVDKYASVLRYYILSREDDFGVRILLQAYEQQFNSEPRVYLPKCLAEDDKKVLLEAYIDSKNVNTNYLSKIIHMRPSEILSISDETRLQAKRKCNEYWSNYFESGNGIKVQFQIAFDSKQEEVKEELCEGFRLVLSYSLNYLLETLDYPSILNNFIHVFDFVDFPQMRSQHVLRPSSICMLDYFTEPNSKRIFHRTVEFEIRQNRAKLQMNAYYNFLEKENVHLEDVLMWVFTEYFQSEVQGPKFKIRTPSQTCTYAEKCTTLLATFDAIMRQFSLYVKNGEIDFDLVEMSTTPVTFKEVKSLLLGKYIYGVGNDYENFAYWLFSDQCMLAFVERIDNKNKKHYKCFAELLNEEDVFISDYRDEYVLQIQRLEQCDLLKIDADGKISFGNMTKVYLISDLYHNDVVSKWHYSSSARKIIDEWLGLGLIHEESTLFSRPEVNYLNYMLNRLEYDNGLELRNRYMHGVMSISTTEEEHYQNYLTIKINDEFELLNKVKRLNVIQNDAIS